MIEDRDIESAVAEGIVSREVVTRLRNHAAASRGAPAADGERFGAVSGLSDIMTCIGLLMVFAIAFPIVFGVAPLLTLGLVPAVWGLAEYFTRRRRQMLASLLLFVIFVLAVSVAMVPIGLLVAGMEASLSPGVRNPTGLPPIAALIIAAGTVSGCALWWWRFRLPIAYAAIVVAGINLLIHVARIAAPDVSTGLVGVVLLLIGLGIFVLAMWWDMSDVRRETVRSDVGFWLHAAAGYQIAAASYRLLFGVAGAGAGEGGGWERLYRFTTQPSTDAGMIAAVLLLAVFCWVALAVDRRSLIMSSILFVAQTMIAPPFGKALATLPVGPLLLGCLVVLLSAFWQQGRAFALALLPVAVQAQLPRREINLRGERPVF